MRQMRISQQGKASQVSGIASTDSKRTAGCWAWLKRNFKWGNVERCLISEALVASDRKLKSTRLQQSKEGTGARD